MPSIMERYVQGLLLGEKLKDTKRQRKWEDLKQQYTAEQIEDIRFQRKTLISQLKQEEKERKTQEKQQAIKSDITRYGVEYGPEALKELFLEPGARELGFTEDIGGALGLEPGLSWEQQQRAREVKAKVRGAPGAIPHPTAPTPSKPTETEKTRQRKIKYLMDQGRTRQEAEDYLTQQRIYGKTTEPKGMTSAQYRSQSSSLESQAEKSTDKTEMKALLEQAKTLRKEANKLFRQEQQRTGAIPDIPSTPTRVTRMGAEETTGVTPPGMLGDIDYPSLAKGIKAELGVTHGATLEAHKEGLLKQFPNLDWETLKSYFE